MLEIVENLFSKEGGNYMPQKLRELISDAGIKMMEGGRNQE
jgi:hypothetical protein